MTPLELAFVARPQAVRYSSKKGFKILAMREGVAHY